MGPVIASISLGAQRLFRLKRNRGSSNLANACLPEPMDPWPEETQKNLKHVVSKELTVSKPRINITFRCRAQGLIEAVKQNNDPTWRWAYRRGNPVPYTTSLANVRQWAAKAAACP